MRKETSRYLLTCFLAVLLTVLCGTAVQAASSRKIQITTQDFMIKADSKNNPSIIKTVPENVTLTCKSSNPDAVTVDSKGRIIGKEAGTAVLTVTAKKNNYKTARKKITVTVIRRSQAITVKTKKKKLQVGSTLDLGASAKTKLKYTSSDPSVLSVSKDGQVTGRTAGESADITIIAKESKVYNKAFLKITIKVVARTSSLITSETDDWITVATPSGQRRYRRYYTYAYSGTEGKYYRSFGCVVDAVSVAASAFGVDHSPKEIHMGTKTKKYTENYALVKLGATKRVSNAALGLPLASQILTDMGIPNKQVSVFKKDKAIKEITKHLKEGKPVIAKVHNRTVNGVKIGYGHHAIVIFGIDEKGNGIFYDTSNGKVNIAHGNKAVMKMSIDTFVKNHMDSPTGNYQSLYVTSMASAGGYILVG